ncbi:MAG: hypothetical protein CVU34_16160 [Betaproteobacteria bacterium HGW-Betaproteobacteria-7]|jgi:hypothetical protein|nr:MAG: hypothetical protein CVU34_16160 [Betaproteobacteria bacterium HGW-Betaproteobacteria-7]
MLRRLAAGFCLWLLCSVPAMAGVAATVVFLTGQPQVIATDGRIRSLVRGSEIAAGETIDTADGRVQLRYRDGATMSLQPATRFRIDRFQYSGSARAVADDGVLMTLLKGGLRTVTGWLGRKERSQYRIGTSVATIGIRGTEFGALLDESGLFVTTYAGLVEVCSEVACRDVAPSETVWVRAAGVRPELRDEAAGRQLNSEGAVPETPVVREVQPMQPPPQAPPPPSPQHYPGQSYRP